jgi:CubicO group peptidase (beta-lactamase class C family)
MLAQQDGRMSISRRTALTGLAGALIAPIMSARAQDWRTKFAPGGEIDESLAALARRDRFSGVAYASVDGAPVLARAIGMADRERAAPNTLQTRFNIASMGKMFTAVAIGQLMEQGRLSFEDSAVRHRPDLNEVLPETVTIANLLSHTSGLGNYFASPLWAERGSQVRSVDDYFALVRRERIGAEYDGSYRYSNSGFVVLGAIIERVTGRDFYDVMRDMVFEAAGMTNTSYPVHTETAPDLAIGYENGCFARPPSQCTPRAWAPSRGGAGRGGPAGGCYSTAGDLDAFAQALRTGRLLRPETFNVMKAARSSLHVPGGPLDGYGLGFGRLTVSGHATWGHNGGTPSWGAQMDCLENAAINLIVLCNQDGGLRAATGALRLALA